MTDTDGVSLLTAEAEEFYAIVVARVREAARTMGGSNVIHVINEYV